MQDDLIYRRITTKRHLYKSKRRKNHASRLKHYKNRAKAYRSNIVRPTLTYGDFTAPTTFSITDNRDETISYLKSVDRSLNQKLYSRMDFTNTEYTDLPTICLLSTYMLDGNTNAKYLEVRIPPKSSPARKIWDEVQFEQMVVRKQRGNFKSGRFLSRSFNEVDLDAIESVVEAAITYFGSDKASELTTKLPPLMVEMMENTAFHADPYKQSRRPWIINTHTGAESGLLEMEFCIVDVGVGVYQSIKNNVSKWNTRRSKIMHRLSQALDNSSTQSKFLAENIPKGVGSSSNEVSRGKGIRYLHDKVSSDTMYSLFDIITNKAHVHLKDLDLIEKDSKENMSATIYHWKVYFK